ERKSVGSYVGGGIFHPDLSMLEQAGATRAEPFSNLFDRNVYSGSNPLATLGADIGVTEYTNANFFTDDTIPGQGSIFNVGIIYPTVTELVPAPIPSPYLTLPRLGSAAFSGARAAKLTGNQAVAKFLLTNTNLDLLGQLQLDDVVYDAYSSHLIPRAVGYSAAVLNYFFRGDMPILRQEYLVSESDEGDEKPFREVGTLDVSIEVPFSLGFQGEMLFYVELSNGNRLEFDRLTWNGTNPVRAFNFPQVDDFVLFEPVRWYVVLKGAMGPGSQEPEAIVGKAGLAIWIVSPLPR
ncbi:MAG: hypothetical protein R3B95_14985, partial [Nitrospirales bacterium]|nr:hypothetical protein [Nitrospirales bacterium]